MTQKEKLCKATLGILAAAGDAGIEENALKIEMEAAMLIPLTNEETTAVLLLCVDKGWVKKRVDDFDNVRVFITESGRNRRTI